MQGYDMTLPTTVQFLIQRLEAHGFEAYAVGGCVRDCLLGLIPKDWDLCTNALPEEILACFSDYHTRTNGKKHGTICVILEHTPYEITTYRTDGIYTDCRRPDVVYFVRNLLEDLRRRDFTINAMAYHPTRGLQDPFDGKTDLNAGILRCVGNPKRRFSEDALRILRGLRFAANYRLKIESKTAQAANDLAPLLQRISTERIAAECDRLLLASGKSAADIFRNFFPVWRVIFPEIIPMQNCAQRHPRHQYTVWEHTLHVLEATPPDLNLRWTALLHDMGKTQTKTTDETGIDHFHGHSVVSERLAKEILHRLHMEKKRTDTICNLVRWHDMPLPENKKAMRRLAAKLGTDTVNQLLRFHLADCTGQSSAALEIDRPKLEQAHLLLNEILTENSCLSRKALNINGDDLIAVGIEKGPQIGILLQMLLEMVIEETIPNEREALLQQAKKTKQTLKNGTAGL